MLEFSFNFRNIHHLKGVNSSLNWRSSFMYNNWMFNLAGYVAEMLGEKTWEQLISEYYFLPLGMQGATFADRANYETNFALPGTRFRNSKDWQTLNSEMLRDLGKPAWAAGGICASADDMTKYLVFLLRDRDAPTDRVLGKTLRETQEPVVALKDKIYLEKPEDPVNIMDTGYGMGWFLGIYRGEANLD